MDWKSKGLIAAVILLAAAFVAPVIVTDESDAAAITIKEFNPITGGYEIYLDPSDTTGTADIVIKDETGTTVWQTTSAISITNGYAKFRLSLEDGTYFVQATINGTTTPDYKLVVGAQTETYKVTVDDNANVAIVDGEPIVGEAIVDKDTKITVSAKDKTGYTAKVLVNGEEFTGSEITVTEDLDITVEYTEIPATEYTVTIGEGAIVLNGEEPVSSGAVEENTVLTISAEERTGYTYQIFVNDEEFTGSEITVTEDLDITVAYTPIEYTITWIVDGVETTESVAYGETPVFTGSTDKAADAQYTYTFAGWDPEVAPVTGAATYTAIYDRAVNEYTITWIVDGVETTESVAYGETPVFTGSTDKAADAQYTYTFAGWEPEITAVTEDAVYTAVYDMTVNEYTVVWMNDDVEFDSDILPYGAEIVAPEAVPEKESDRQYNYTFAGWNGYTEGMTVSGDVAFEAVFDANPKGAIDQDTTLPAGTVINDTLTVNPGVTVTLDGDVTIAEGGNMYVYGNLAAYNGAEIQVLDGGLLKTFDGATIMQSILVVGEGEIDLDGAMSTMVINNDVASSNTYSQTQVVVIGETLNLKAGTTTTILGKLVIDNGVILTVEKNATLVIDSQTAEMLVDGKIVVDEGGSIMVLDAKDVTVQGSIVSEGYVFINSTVVIKSGAKILIDESDSSIITVWDGLTVEASAELEIRGEFYISQISNKGTITLKDAVMTWNSTISMDASDAVVNIESYYVSTVLDYLSLTIIDGTNAVDIDAVDNAGIRGLKVIEKVDSRDNKTLYISGSVAAVDESEIGNADAPEIAISGDDVKVSETLTLGAEIILENYADLTVTGTIDATATDAGIDNYGTIDVPGLIMSKNKVAAEINAALFEKDGVKNYTNLPAAVKSGAETVTLLGEVELTESLEVPAGVKLKGETTTTWLVIGSTDDRDVVLTMKDGSELKQLLVDVYGTLDFANKKDNKVNAANIYSDVSVVGEVASKYTNVYTALKTASAGDVVTITRDVVTLDKDVAIESGVTLNILNGKSLSLNDKVTLTVKGVLKTATPILAQTAFAAKAGEGASAIVVEGVFMSMDDLTYDYYKTAGAYYNMVDSNGNYNYVTPVDYAASVADKVTDYIAVNGANTVGDVSFTGVVDDPAVIVINYGSSLKASNITLKEIIISVNGTFDGNVVSDKGTVSIVNSAYFIIGAVSSEDYDVMAIGGMPTTANTDKKSSVTIVSGTVEAADLCVCNLDSFVISAGAKLSVSSFDGYAYEFDAEELTVNGTLEVTDGGRAYIGTLTILGSFTVGAASDDVAAGEAYIDTLYVGTTAKDIGSDAVVSGVFDVDSLAYVLNGSTIDENLVKDVKSTQFIVSGSVWMTVYYFDENKTVDVNAPIDNAKFIGWAKTEGSSTAVTITSAVAKAYAIVDYEVYQIAFVLAEGIDDVYVDGILVDIWDTPLLKAGEHTVSYTLANGYSGTATMLVNGEKVTGYKFTTTGNDYATSVYKITLQGIEKSGYVPESPDVPTPVEPTEKDDSLGITEYLLIVLVILAAILVVVVAIRMMRS